MKYKTFLFGLFLLFLISIGCRQNQAEQLQQPGSSDSLETATDESAAADMWNLYSYDERRGMQIFNRYCVICHGQSGEGDGFNSYTLDPRPRSMADSTYMAGLDDATLEQIISFGGRGVNRSVLMPAYLNTLSKNDISNLVKYIRTFLSDNKAPE